MADERVSRRVAERERKKFVSGARSRWRLQVDSASALRELGLCTGAISPPLQRQ